MTRLTLLLCVLCLLVGLAWNHESTGLLYAAVFTDQHPWLTVRLPEWMRDAAQILN